MASAGQHITSATGRPLVYSYGFDEAAATRVAGETNAPDAHDNGNERRGEPTVPVTILTGFLGAGKTTLLNRILTQNHGKRIAVVQNEFGEDLGLGSTVAAEGMGGEVFEECFEMNNGCICCSIRDELVTTLERIMKKRHKFDYVLVETTGMANPGPLANIFWLDDELGSELFLDGIVTLVDAKHVLQHLDDPSPSGGSYEVAQQIAFADRILVNKIDLVSDQDLLIIEARIRSINPTATIVRTCKSDVDLDLIMDVRAFDSLRAQDLEIAVNTYKDDDTDERAATASTASDQHSSGRDFSEPLQPLQQLQHDLVRQALGEKEKEKEKEKGRHNSDISSVAAYETAPLDERKVNLWLGGLLWESDAGKDIFRLKGILSISGHDSRVVLQGVHTLFEILPSRAPWAESTRYSKVVFIGRNLKKAVLQHGLSSCRTSLDSSSSEACLALGSGLRP